MLLCEQLSPYERRKRRKRLLEEVIRTRIVKDAVDVDAAGRRRAEAEFQDAVLAYERFVLVYFRL